MKNIWGKLNKKVIAAVVIGLTIVLGSNIYITKSKEARLHDIENRLSQGNPPAPTDPPETIHINIDPDKVKEQVENPANKGKFVLANLTDNFVARGLYEDQKGKVIILASEYVGEEDKYINKKITFDQNTYKFSDVEIITQEDFNKLYELTKEKPKYDLEAIHKKLGISEQKYYQNIFEMKDGRILFLVHKPKFKLYNSHELKIYDPLSEDITIIDENIEIKDIPRALIFNNRTYATNAKTS